MKNASHYGLWLALLSTALILGACGIKPKDMLPPEGSEDSTFPKTYPAE